MKRFLFSFLIAATFLTFEQTLLAQTAPTKAWDKGFGGSGIDQLYALQATSDGGYILGGNSASNLSGDKTQASKGSYDFWVVKTDATGNKIWDRTFGGNNFDGIGGIQETIDGGYILAGGSSSGISGDKTQASKGLGDFWIVKVDGSGNKLWDKSFGGSGSEGLAVVRQTIDGGYILGGQSTSGISGDKSEALRGTIDLWIVKIDFNGNKVWDKTFGGNSDENLYDLKLTIDGGYVLAARSLSGISGDKTQPNRGTNTLDFWIVKIDASGNKLWDKTYGGTDNDEANVIEQMADGSYIVGGTTLSGQNADKSQPSKGGYDFWVLKLDVNGNKVWDKTIGGNADEDVKGLQVMSDGSIVIGGSSESNISGDKSQNNIGSPIDNDYWIIKLDPLGNKIWDKTVGTGGNDDFNVLVKNSNSELILGGYSNAGISADKTEPSKGGNDYWVVKLNPTCADLTASLSSACTLVGTNVNVNVTGIQPAVTGSPSWTLTYTANGVTQTVTNSATTFTLSPNATNGTVYNLVSITSGSCTQNLTGSLTVAPVPQPVINSIAPDTLSSSVAGNAYEWKFNGTILPNTTRKIKATASGLYSVQVKNTNNCNSPVSADYSFVVSGIKETIAAGIELYPNPTAGIINLVMKDQQSAQVSVLNALGQVIISKTVGKSDEKVNLALNLTGFAKGLYLIQIVSEDLLITRKIVLQ